MPKKFPTLSQLNEQRSILAKTERLLEEGNWCKGICYAISKSIAHEGLVVTGAGSEQDYAANEEMKDNISRELGEIMQCWPHRSGDANYPIAWHSSTKSAREQYYLSRFAAPEEGQLFGVDKQRFTEWRESGGLRGYTALRRNLWQFIKDCVDEVEYE